MKGREEFYLLAYLNYGVSVHGLGIKPEQVRVLSLNNSVEQSCTTTEAEEERGHPGGRSLKEQRGREEGTSGSILCPNSSVSEVILHHCSGRPGRHYKCTSSSFLLEK